MKTEYPESLLITTPVPEQAADMVDARRAWFIQELVDAGVASDAVVAHTRDWGWDGGASYRAHLETWLGNPQRYFCRVVMRGADVVGLIVANFAGPEDESHYVSAIQLDESIRRQGIGRRLFELFRDEIQADPTKPTRLDVLPGNTGARAFYDAMGFTQVDDRETMTINGISVPMLTLERPAKRGLYEV